LTLLTLFFLYASSHPRVPHSFPTRRSSDLRGKQYVHQACACVRAAPSPWASTNHSHLSTPREISVQMSVESASPSSSVSSIARRSEEHTSELQSPCNLVCRLLLEKKNKQPS